MTNIMPACHSAANATDIAAVLLTLMFFINMYNLALILKKVYKPADMQFKATMLKTIARSVTFFAIASFDYFIADEAFAEEIWTAVATSAMNMEFLMLLGYLMPDFDDDETVDPLVVLLACSVAVLMHRGVISLVFDYIEFFMGSQ